MRFVLLALVLAACGTPAETPQPGAEPPAAPAEGARKGKAPPGEKAAERVDVQLFFLDQAKYAAGEGDAVVPVTRKVAATTQPRNALWQLFKGPTPKEAERGLTLVASGATGFETVRIADGIAHVTLKGGCDAGGATLTVYDLIVPTMKQFEFVQHVKVYDPEGQTADPTSPADSRPACLEP